MRGGGRNSEFLVNLPFCDGQTGTYLDYFDLYLVYIHTVHPGKSFWVIWVKSSFPEAVFFSSNNRTLAMSILKLLPHREFHTF